MRLKSLFFPIMIVLSLAVFVGYIWPEIRSIRRINEEILAKKNEMQNIADKKAAIELVGKEISDATTENIVFKYLPQNKMEDQIIGGINYLAGDANVSLADISMNSIEDESIKKDSETAVAIPVSLVGASASLSEKAANNSALEYTSAKITLVGDYSKIRIFLDSLQRMSVINTIKSVVISSQEASKAVVSPDTTSVATASGDVLVAIINVDFGHLATAKVNNMQVEKFKNAIDNEVVETLQAYVSTKSQLADDDNTNTGARGKKNPFLIN